MITTDVLLVWVVGVVFGEVDDEVKAVVFVVSFDRVWAKLSNELGFTDFVEFLVRTALRHLLYTTYYELC